MKLNKFTIVLIFVTSSAFADKRHHDYDYSPPVEPPVIINNTTTTILKTSSDGVATAIATGQCQFDWTYSWQGCAALGTYDGGAAYAFGVGKRYEKVLLNGIISIEDDELGVGIAANWKF